MSNKFMSNDCGLIVIYVHYQKNSIEHQVTVPLYCLNVFH